MDIIWLWNHHNYIKLMRIFSKLLKIPIICRRNTVLIMEMTCIQFLQLIKVN